MNNKQILCFDIGGLGLKYSIYDFELNEIYYSKIEYKLPPIEKVFQMIKQIYNSLKKTYTIDGIAISSSGIIDPKNKIIYSLRDSKFSQRDLNLLMNWCEIEWKIENDANCAMLAEKYFGNAKEYKNAILITIGTALGGALLINSEIYRGSNFGANEIGAGILYDQKPFKNISVYTGLNGMITEYNNKFQEQLTGKEIFDLAVNGDKNSLKIVEERIDNICKVMFNLQLTIDGQIFLIGGAVSKSAFFINKIKSRIEFYEKELGFPFLAKIKNCKFYNDSGKIGALCLFLKES